MKHTVLKSWFRAGLLPAIVSMALSGQAQAVTVNFDGELLDRPCQVAPESLQQGRHFSGATRAGFLDGTRP